MKKLTKIVIALAFFFVAFNFQVSEISAACGVVRPGFCINTNSDSLCSAACAAQNPNWEPGGCTQDGDCICDDLVCTLDNCPTVPAPDVCILNDASYLTTFSLCGGAGSYQTCCSLPSECATTNPPQCASNQTCVNATSSVDCTIYQGTYRPCSMLTGFIGNCCINNFNPTSTPFPTPTPNLVSCRTNETCIGISSGQCFQNGGRIENCRNTQTGEAGTCCYPDESPLPTPPSPPGGPWPSPYVPCEGDAERDPLAFPQYHSLRPFQASPCRQHGLSADRGGQLKLYCGNDIIVKETFSVGPGDGICTASDNILTCDFRIPSTVDVNIDLTDAELPIMGNTQLVPNQINNGNPAPENFAWNRRVNEYLSWWLEGVPYKADEELMAPAEINIEYPHRHIEAYAGPIRKLYPNPIVSYRRRVLLPVPHFVYSRAPNPRSDRAGQSRDGELHDQIYVCTLGNNQVPCRWNFTLQRYEIIDTRGTDQPEDDLVYPTTARWVTDPGSPESPYMLMTSTDDMLGTILTSAIGTPQITFAEPAQQVTIEDFVFEPIIDTDLLYFAHMEENVGLVELLQRTYRPRSIMQDGGSHEPIVYYNTYRCDLDDVRWNTGDDLFGELGPRTSFGIYQDLTPVVNSDNSQGVTDPVTGESIVANINYTAVFQCEFNCDGTLLGNDCIRDGCNASCMAGLSNPECQDEPYANYPDPTGCCRGVCSSELTCERDALTAASVYTRTPKVEELWLKTIDGDASLINRMFPKIVNELYNHIKNLPAITSARYWSSKTGDPDGQVSEVQVFAGEPSNERSGERAEIFIPRIGSIYELAMITMQDLLRPQIMNSMYLQGGLPPGSGDPVPPGTVGNCQYCSENPTANPGSVSCVGNYCSFENLMRFFPDEVSAKNASMVCLQETGGNPYGNINTGCLTETTPDYSVGMFMINIQPRATFTPRCPDGFVIDDGTHSANWCEIADQDIVDQCVIDFRDPDRNAQEAASLACGSNNVCTFSDNWIIASRNCGLP